MNYKNITKNLDKNNIFKSYTLESKNDNKNIASINKKFILELPSRSLNNNLKNSTKTVEYTSPTSVWKNSIYSFNKNYVKNIPSVDSIVNKMIKSFFTLNALDNNIKGKKSRLIQRRYKRLSLNRIFISKSEIKHNNNNVNITVYLFNKKKRSLLLNLRKWYDKLTLNLSFNNRSWRKTNKFENMVPNVINSNNDKLTNLSSLQKSKLSMVKKNNLNLKSSVYNTVNNTKYSKKLGIKSYGYSFNYNIKNKNKALYIKNKVLYYNRINNLAKYNMYKYINIINAKQTVSKYNSSNKLLKLFFVYTNQYKLYNNIYSNNYLNNMDYNLNNSSNVVFTNENPNIGLSKMNYSISKLRSIYKIFTLYNNFSFGFNSENKYSVSQIYSKKLMLNTYKMLKKSTLKNTSFISNSNYLKASPQFIGSPLKFKPMLKKNKNIKPNRLLLSKTNNINKLYIGRNKNAVILMKNLNRIDKFFEKYKNVFQKLAYTKDVSTTSKIEKTLSNQIMNNYKISFINDILEKEFKYIYYLKLLSYNNALFKNWLLFPLKTLMAKIYNKKVVLNIINLKYMHLNSDILTQAVNIKLRNFRKNRVVGVLKKAVKLVYISRVNIYACDEHSSMYKYINNYYDKFKSLKLDIFKDLGIINNNKIEGSHTNTNDIVENNGYKPYIIRNLNHVQTSTINFIKFKSVFGVRLEAAGRLTKRSTASRALFKFRYKGTLKNNPTITRSLSATMVKNHQISNLQYTQISSKTRNGAFGLKGWINAN